MLSVMTSLSQDTLLTAAYPRRVMETFPNKQHQVFENADLDSTLFFIVVDTCPFNNVFSGALKRKIFTNLIGLAVIRFEA